MNDRIIISADIGGSHITCAAVDLQRKNIIDDSRVRRSLNPKGTVSEVIGAWCDAINATGKLIGCKDALIGLAMPGPYDYENGICYISENDKYESLYGVNVKHEIARSLGIAHQHIRMKNDAACFLEGEVFAGAAQGFSRAAGVTLGTGVGSAYFCNGVATDAEWWNRPFKDSIAELYFSTRWFVKRYYELTGKSVVNVKELIQQENVECVAVIFDEFSKNLSILLADLVCAHDPEVLVIGGNITKAADFFLSQVQDQLYDRKINVGIRISHLGEGAAIIGASTCWN